MHSHKNWGKLPQGFHLSVPKCILFCFLTPMQSGLSATYPAPILTIFEIKDVSQCVHAYTSVKNFQISVQGFQAPRIAKMGNFEGVFVTEVQLKQHNFNFSSDGNRFKVSRHPKNVPFVCKFWWGMYSLGAEPPSPTQKKYRLLLPTLPCCCCTPFTFHYQLL